MRSFPLDEVLDEQTFGFALLFEIVVHVLDREILAQYIDHVVLVNRIEIELAPQLALFVVVVEHNHGIADVRGKYNNLFLEPVVVHCVIKIEILENLARWQIHERLDVIVVAGIEKEVAAGLNEFREFANDALLRLLGIVTRTAADVGERVAGEKCEIKQVVISRIRFGEIEPVGLVDQDVELFLMEQHLRLKNEVVVNFVGLHRFERVAFRAREFDNAAQFGAAADAKVEHIFERLAPDEVEKKSGFGFFHATFEFWINVALPADEFEIFELLDRIADVGQCVDERHTDTLAHKKNPVIATGSRCGSSTAS